MAHQSVLQGVDLERLCAFDTCTVSNAIERLNVRLRNEGFVSHTVNCQFPSLPPILGYAVTGRIHTASPPMNHRCYYDRMDWWNYVASMPEPRIIVLQDADYQPGLGAFVGEIHAAIALALKCIGCVTNGAVRDLPAVQAMGFQMFAGSVAVSHAYAHITEFGEPVEIGGLKISPGDLLHGDRHGVLAIPQDIAREIPEEASKIRAEERALVEFCRSPHFSMEALSERIQSMTVECSQSGRAR